MKRFAFDIDVGGACNLRCPSCPQGNVRNYRLPQGLMDPELLARIIKKAKSECHVTDIRLFSWAEPMLHPKLAEMICLVQNMGINCYLSSNLNILPNADAVMAANPFSFRISASGFTQEVYGRSHRGGDIEKVKKHMVKLSKAKKRNKADTEIYVYYHRYRHNLKEEPLMREFAAGLGIHFQSVWALFFPLEKILSIAGDYDSDFPVTPEDLQVIDLLAIPVKEALDASAKRDKECHLRDAQVSMDFQGNVQLCCGIFDSGKFTLGNYLEMPLDEIQHLRQLHEMCALCTRRSAHVYLTYGAADQLDEIAAANVAPEDAELLGLRYELAQKKLRRRLEKVYQRYFARVLTDKQKEALVNQFDRLERAVGRAKRSLSGRS